MHSDRSKKVHFIGGQWHTGQGASFQSLNPLNGEIIWEGRMAEPEAVDAAVKAARECMPEWSATPQYMRDARMRVFAGELKLNHEKLARLISMENGKPLWESRTEVQAMIGKVEISIDAYQKRCVPFKGGAAMTRFRPHGVCAVLGPYNFPGHLPNGHIIPALLAGNTVVFKPSELTPRVAQCMTALWEECNLPPGVLNLVQGDGATGQQLVTHEGVDAVFFTGSASTGQSIKKQTIDQSGKILALEMGGNNPLLAHQVGNLDAVVSLILQSAFISAGQRCTCARRIILIEDREGEQIQERLVREAAKIRCGAWDQEPPPFMGPVISKASAEHLLKAQQDLIQQGARPLLTMQAINASGTLLSPGILDVTPIRIREDAEFFGPLLQIVKVPDFQAAIVEANNTAFGLAAGLLSDRRDLWDRFSRRIRAGIVNWNTPLTGASSAAPFGGIGKSGNHRPSAYLAADYCSYPVASMEKETVELPEQLPPGLIP